jgi:hypothetical protein
LVNDKQFGVYKRLTDMKKNAFVGFSLESMRSNTMIIPNCFVIVKHHLYNKVENYRHLKNKNGNSRLFIQYLG